MADPLNLSLGELSDRQSLEGAREPAQAQLAQSGSRLARARWPMLRDAAADCMRIELDKLSPFDVLARAWGKAVELQELAEKTRAAPGSKETYPIASHSLSASIHPVVTLKLGPLTFPGLTFTVTLEGMVEAAILSITAGKIESVEALKLIPSAALSYGELVLNRLKSDPVTLGSPYVFANGGLDICFD